MTNEPATEKTTRANGRSTLQAALLLGVIGIVLAIAGGSGIAWVFLVGAGICAVVGLIQKDSRRS